MNEALITLNNLSIGYNNHPVMKGISLAIPRSGFTAILGANGSGKSTLLKTMLGLLPPVSGNMETSGEGPLVFGYVPQFVQFDPIYLLTGFDVALMGVYGRVGPGRPVPAAERVFTRECLAAAGAGEFASKRFSQLSGGQKQRVLIARALATRPDVLVMDEPTAGVDRETTESVLEFIAQLRREKGITILLVTHDIAAARRHVEQVIWLHEGKVLHGPAKELLTTERMAQIFETEVL
ncbi:MAG TPA: metal ABC transporter ATP-binding protein [Geobacteraceae bacterium]|nr:metal ABC transporter ATP-binding protein [Geobacteraceae bacterium]